MIHTKIINNTLVAFGDSLNGTVVEIADPSWNKATIKTFLENRLKDRQMFGYTIYEQICLFDNCFTPKQW